MIAPQAHELAQKIFAADKQEPKPVYRVRNPDGGVQEFNGICALIQSQDQGDGPTAHMIRVIHAIGPLLDEARTED